MTTKPPDPDPPLRLGTPEQFSVLAKALRDARYEEETVCQALKISSISAVGTVSSTTVDLTHIPDQLAVFIRLFLLFESVPGRTIESLFSGPTLEALRGLDVIRTDDSADNLYYASVFLYPFAGFFIASDQYKSRDGLPFNPPVDAVFPAVYSGTLLFLRLLWRNSANDAIDLCSGSGIGAFELAKYVKRAVAADITPRATHFAHFNRMLNASNNVDVLCGDLYDPAGSETFDLIVAHPPYMPAIQDTVIWRDGGATGETLVQRIIAGLPRYLQVGGSFQMVCLGVDTKDAPFERRARGWLAESEGEFDVIFAWSKDILPGQVARVIAERDQHIAASDVARFEQHFKDIGAVKLVYGAFFIRRREPGDIPPLTVRTRLSDATEGSDFDSFLQSYYRRSVPGFLDGLRSAKPRLGSDLTVNAAYFVRDGELAVNNFEVQTEKPFLAVTRFDGWVLQLIAELKGDRTVAEIYDSSRAANLMPESFEIADFVSLISMLIERGYLTLQ